MEQNNKVEKDFSKDAIPEPECPESRWIPTQRLIDWYNRTYGTNIQNEPFNDNAGGKTNNKNEAA